MKIVTTPIFYPNSKPHFGHTYSCVLADCIKRYLHLRGHDCILTTGLDEHGQKIAKTAQAADMQPQAYVNKMQLIFKKMMGQYNVQYDVFTRTTNPIHKRKVQEIYRDLKPYIYKSKYKGWYSISDEEFIKSEQADALKAIGKSVQWISESCYFFKLSAFEDMLIDYYKDAKIYPNNHELLSFVSRGLRDIAITREKVKWGVSVPNISWMDKLMSWFRPERTIYVWVDALVNYITATEHIDNPEFIHVLGKDIARFHGVYWPAFLTACNRPLPSALVIHGWWLVNDQKMSKSIGSVVDPIELLDRYSSDQLRWFMLREMSLGSDSDISDQQIALRVSEFANNYCNLVHRTFSLLLSKYDGKILARVNTIIQTETVHEHMNEYRVHMYAQAIMTLCSACNKYLDLHKPWSNDDGHQILSDVVFAIKELTELLQPLVPETGARVLGWIKGDRITETEILWQV